ncbi:MAG: fumarylacetoacetate hydrolase family protein [Alicyclobacillus herbarius]|uniref:fumarylacetoacetate hydrolase family protein n=1 Tax=Alicyclobacillus herbarius TaxID=122960 RepID=UPI0023541D9A|nr:fumarylacetoacetate hydrolase family protein [Alicyclobacillus herbarius]MCL6632262.1 fumarylacetoacetate hydrolase family protein [Alicyclobacillus herbarius]
MKIANVHKDGRWQLAIADGERLAPVFELAEAAGEPVNSLPQTVDDYLAHPDLQASLQQLCREALHTTRWQGIHAEEAVFGPCVLRPQKVICIGLNYRKHAAETGAPVPENPVVFSKFNNALAGHRESIPLPSSSTQVDYEAELAIVIGKRVSHVEPDRALDVVAGYSVANDVSARDLQMRTPQWLLGKTCDKFAPLGPYLVTADEVPNPNDLPIRTYVNGEIRQDSNTSDMIFSCAELVSYLSQHMTLVPGDVILTGTPEGVILGMAPEAQRWLQDGDEVSVEIVGLGRLTNRFVQVS